MHKTDINILISALKILSRDIESGDGVANAAIYEGATRLEELRDEVMSLEKELAPYRDEKHRKELSEELRNLRASRGLCTQCGGEDGSGCMCYSR